MFRFLGPCPRFLLLLPFVGAVSSLRAQAVTSLVPDSVKASPAAPQTITPQASRASTTSSSKQFVIYGADLNTRGTFATASEDIAASLCRLFKDEGQYTLPTVIVIKTASEFIPAAPAVSTSITAMEPSGFHLQVTVQLRPDFRKEDFTREMVRILLAERILRNHTKLTTTRQRVLPDWVLYGVTQALDFRSRAHPSALFAAVFRSGQVYSIERIIAADSDRLDAVARVVYDASSCALVLTLLDQPEGPVRFLKFLNELATASGSDRDLLQDSFPGFSASQHGLEKWWTLQMATLASPSPLETLGINETETRLDEALTLEYDEKPKAPGAEKKGMFQWLKGGKKDEGEPAPGKATGEATVPAASWLELLEGSRQVSILSLFKKKTDDSTDANSAADADKDKAKEKDATKSKDKKPEAKKETPKETADKAKEKETPKAKEKPAEKAKEKSDDHYQERVVEHDKAKEKAAEKPKEKGAEKPKEKGDDRYQERVAEHDKAKEKAAEKPKEKGDDRYQERVAEHDKAKEKTAEKPKEKVVEKPKEKTDDHYQERLANAPKNKEKKPEPKAEEPKPAEAPAAPKPEVAHKAPDLNPFHWFHHEKGKTEPTPNTATAPAAPIPGKEEPKEKELASHSAAEHPHHEAPAPPPPAPEPEPERARPRGPTLADYNKIWDRKDRTDILAGNLQRLQELQQHSHSLYKNLIGQYVAEVQKLIDGKTRGVSARLTQLQTERRRVHERARALESYVDWYEASESKQWSGNFDDYLRLEQRLSEETPKQSDEISKYLDAVEKEYEN